MLLSCENLKHWSLESFIEELHQGQIDYDDLINLRLEHSVAPLQTKWNEFDDIKPETLLLHTTEKLTQPWRAGLKLNSSIPPSRTDCVFPFEDSYDLKEHCFYIREENFFENFEIFLILIFALHCSCLYSSC